MNRTKNNLTIIFLFYLISLSLQAQDMHFEWGRNDGSDQNTNELKSLASDDAKHVFAFTNFELEYDIDGYTYYSEGGKDLLLYAVNESGEVEWVSQQGGIDNEYAQEVKCDSDGNVYIIGKFHESLVMEGITYSSNGSFDMFLAKYSNTGAFLWCKTLGGPNSESLVSLQLKYNRIIVAGRFYDYTVIEDDTLFSQAGTDVFLAKFDLDGNLRHTQTIGGEGVDMVSDMGVDAAGNIYVTGDFYKDINFGGGYSFDVGDLLGVYVAKFNPSLNIIWAYQIIGDDLKPEIKLGVAADGSCGLMGVFSSNVYIGSSHYTSNAGREELYMANLSPDMQLNWAKHFYAESSLSLVDVELDREGGTYIAGPYSGDVHFDDLVLDYTLC
jgi:hypothetical protein